MQIWNLHTNKRERIKNQSRDTVQFTLPDTLVYAKIISPLLHITRRYVGTEDEDHVTNQFNTYLERILPTYDIELKVIKRIKGFDDMSISGSTVRQMIKDSHTSESLLKFIPKTTLDVLKERLR